MQKADYIRKLKIENMDRIAAYRRQLYENPRLRDLFIEVTSRCNAHCDHCGSRCDSRVQPDEVTAEALKNTLLEISRTYDPQDILLNITGGEPLMREDLFDIMGYASNLGFRWGMTTNGMLIDDDVIEKMVETGMETISISIDGLKETHESFRHVPNSFDRIIENIKKLQQTPSIKIVQVTTVVSKRNIHELESLYELMQNIDIVSWRIINVDPIGRAMDNKDILLDPKDYRYLFEFIKEKRKEGLIENIELGCSCLEGLFFKSVKLVSLTNVTRNGNDLAVVIVFLEPRNDDRCIKSARICKYYFFNIFFVHDFCLRE